MSIKWIGTVSLVTLFALVVVLPTGLVCGASPGLALLFFLGVLVSYFLFAATEHHESFPRTPGGHRLTQQDQHSEFRHYRSSSRRKAVGSACLAIAAWVPYVIVLLSLGWTGWWWALAITFFLISVVIVLDLAGTVLLSG